MFPAERTRQRNGSFRQAERPSGGAFLCLLSVLLTTGCHKTPPAPVVYTEGWIRLENLLPLHPGWDRVRRIDAMLADAAKPPAAPPNALPLGQVVFPPSLPDNLAANADKMTDALDTAQQKVLEERAIAPAVKRVARVREAAQRRAARQLAQERSVSEEELAGKVAVRKADLLTTLPAERERLQRAFDQRTLPLRLKEFAYNTQVDAYKTFPATEPAKSQALENLRRVQQQLAQEEGRLRTQIATVESDLAQRVEDYREELESELDRRMQSRQQALTQEADRQVARAETTIRQQIARVRPMTVLRPRVITARPDNPAPEKRPLLAPSQLLVSVVPPTGEAPTGSDAVTALRQERGRLIGFLREDMKRRVERIANLQHWRIVYTPSAAPELTAQVTERLRHEWKP